MKGVVIRILGQDILELYVGRPKDDGTKPPEDEGTTSVSTHLESGFGFVPAGIEFDKPQPE
ncbi:hypothetical protein SEA_SURVIVORS_4 [Gordonia phage Survivors]|nr:hypothetical protein SEA_SURVIVORS_4 [Gordonia phage Survivors]